MDNQAEIKVGETEAGENVVFIRFADSPIPEFKEVRNKDFILYGEDNAYPEYLTYLYNKSSKHGAIIDAKSDYIFGNGFERKNPAPGGFAPYTDPDGIVTPGKVVNLSGETFYDVIKKSIKDVEIYAGFRLIITFSRTGKIAEIIHKSHQSFRLAKGGGWWYKTDWKDNREKAIFYPDFDPDKTNVSAVYAYNEYRPGSKYYPLPGYIGSCNSIETDIEISRFHLSSIRNGMMPSKMIQFFNGEPSEDKKKKIQRTWESRFSGAGNAGKFILIFNKKVEEEVKIDDLSFNELDKQFEQVGKKMEQDIITGHRVTSPMLFGIKTEGQLGGNNELKTAYELFINTYAKPKQQKLERTINYFGGLMGLGTDYYFVQLDPVGIVLSVQDFIDDLPKEFVFEKLGIPKKYWPAAAQAPAQTQPAVTEAQQMEEDKAAGPNSTVTNLTAKQHQQLMRIIRQHSKGQITTGAAVTMMRAAYGFADDEIYSMLGIEKEEQAQAFADAKKYEDEVLQMFDAMGDLKGDYHILKVKKVKFSSEQEAADDENDFFEQAFKTTDVTNSEAAILDLIKKDKRITPEVIAKTIGSTTEYVTAKIGSLVKRGLIESATQTIGEDVQIERTVTQPISDINPPSGTIETTEILIKYSYEGPKDNRNRPFCRKLLDLDRLYSRSEIETISQRLGYSVFDRRGGWWTKPDGTRSPSCRHRWMSNVIVKKGGSK